MHFSVVVFDNLIEQLISNDLLCLDNSLVLEFIIVELLSCQTFALFCNFINSLNVYS
mgnify:FL=1